jgi:type I restriction enzyme S subunit
VNQHVCIIRLNAGNNSNFIQSILASDKGQTKLKNLSTGSGREGLNFQSIKNLEVYIPSIQEQTKIANFLSSIDEKINLLKEKKSLLEEYKKGIMQKIFNQEIRFKDDNGNDFADWEVKTLGEIGTFQTSSIDKISRDDEEEVFLVNYLNVYKHENINNYTKQHLQIVTAKNSQITSCNLKKGDILFTPSSETPDDIGQSVVIFEDLNNCVYSYHLMRFRPNIEIDILYSHYFCNNTKVLGQISRLATGSTRFTISVKSFSSIIIDLPCLKEQSKIANFLTAIDEKIELVSNQIQDTQEYKKGLLQQMFV